MKLIYTATDSWKEKRKLSAKLKNAGKKKPMKLRSFTDTTGTHSRKMLNPRNS